MNIVKRPRKLEKKIKVAEQLNLERPRLMKAQNQPNQTNLKLCQDKKELHKERKMFNVMMVEGRNELRQGAGVEATQQQASTDVENARYS